MTMSGKHNTENSTLRHILVKSLNFKNKAPNQENSRDEINVLYFVAMLPNHKDHDLVKVNNLAMILYRAKFIYWRSCKLICLISLAQFFS